MNTIVLSQVYIVYFFLLFLVSEIIDGLFFILPV